MNILNLTKPAREARRVPQEATGEKNADGLIPVPLWEGQAFHNWPREFNPEHPPISIRYHGVRLLLGHYEIGGRKHWVLWTVRGFVTIEGNYMENAGDTEMGDEFPTALQVLDAFHEKDDFPYQRIRPLEAPASTSEGQILILFQPPAEIDPGHDSAERVHGPFGISEIHGPWPHQDVCLIRDIHDKPVITLQMVPDYTSWTRASTQLREHALELARKATETFGQRPRTRETVQVWIAERIDPSRAVI